MLRMGDGSGNGGVDKDDFMELMRELGLWVNIYPKTQTTPKSMELASKPKMETK